jgi:integrase
MALNDTFIKKSTKHSGKPTGDKHADGGGMYLLVKAAGKYWRWDYTHADKRKTLALGVYPDVGLADARKACDKARKLLAQGTDPSAAKREAKQAKAAAAASTFELVARAWLDKTAPERMASTQDKIKTWLEKDVFPFIGLMPIGSVGPRDVLATVRKMEARGAIDSAHRVKQVCGQVMRFAVATGSAERDVTADLKGALAKVIAGNHPAITDPKAFGALLRSIAMYSGHPAAVAGLKLSPLVFVRPGELRMAEWQELDFDTGEWRIPGSKMKMKVDHIVPLSTQALAILRELHPITGHGRFVFPSLRTGERPMSENTINAALRAMGYAKDVHTAHGFRASARTIMDEVLGERVDLIEHQLSHTVKDANGRAYNRTAHLPARREMMQRWADYCDRLATGADVIQLKAA